MSRSIYNTIKVLLSVLVIITAGCIHTPTRPGKAEIVFEIKPKPEVLKGSIDFIGFQKYRYQSSYNDKPLYSSKSVSTGFSELSYIYSSPSIDEQKKLLFLFLKNLDLKMQKKVHNLKHNSSFKSAFFEDEDTAYQQTFFREQIPVYDKLRDGSVPYDDEHGRMDDYCLSFLKKYSNADYFFVVSIRPLEVILPGDNNAYSSMRIALLTVLYNNQSEKVYSKIYEETIDGIKDPKKDKPYYNCALKLIEHYGEQINKDLSFLITADDAKNPTLEDLYFDLTKKTDKKVFK